METRSGWRALRSDASTLRQRFQFLPGFTISICTLLLVVAIRLGVFTRELPLLTGLRYGFSGRIVWSIHRWSSLWTSALLSRDAFMAISLATSIVATLGIYEAIAGWRRAATVALGAAIVAPLTVVGIAQLVGLAGNTFALRTLQTVDYGASTVSASAGGALAAIAGPTLRRALVTWLVIGSLLHHQLADAEHLVSFAFGFAVSKGWAPTSTATPATLVVNLRRAALIFASVLAGVSVATETTPGAGRPRAHAESPARPTSPIRVEMHSYPTPSIGGSQTVYVVYPAGYDENVDRRYPVVELLHGHPGSAIDIMTGLDVPASMSTAGIPPFILLAPDGIGPIVPDSFYADTTLQNVGTAVSVDLVSWATTQLRTTTQWSVGGLSAGGYGAAYLTSTHPDIYRAGCSMSGNFEPQGRAFANQSTVTLDADTPTQHTGPSLPPMMLIVGDQDRTGMADANRYHAAMTARGQTNTVVVGSGGHDWGLWKAQLTTCLRYLVTPPDVNGNRAVGPNRPG